MKKFLFIALVIFILLFTVAYGSFITLQKIVNRPLNVSQPSYFTFPNGSGRVVFEQALLQQQLIKPSKWLSAAIWIEFKTHKIKAGTYNIMPNMTLNQLFSAMISGKEAQFAVQFIDGTNFNTWLSVLNNASYLKHTITGLSEQALAKELGLQQYAKLEGLFFPDTYYYTAGITDISILKRAAQKMQDVLQQTWQNRAPDLPYQSSYQLLILASIIEKETGLISEKPLVASVFINRLQQGIRLQSDPTVIYGMGDLYHGKITSKDLKTDTPYNTYTIKGLPPTPIAAVSLSSLQAAAHPANTQYLYFVADGKGGHLFSRTLKEHDKAVSAYITIINQQKNNKRGNNEK